MRFIVVVLLYLSASFLQAQDTVIVQDLRHAWMQFTDDGNVRPYLQSESTELLFFEIPDLKLTNYNIRFSSDSPVDIWVNGKLYLHALDTTVYISARELKPKDQVKVFRDGGIPLGFQADVVQFDDLLVSGGSPAERTSTLYHDFYLTIMVILLLLAGVFRKFFPIAFKQCTRNPLKRKVRSINVDESYGSFGSMDNIFSIFFLSSLMTLIGAFLGYEFYLIEGGTFISEIVNWIIVAILYCGVIAVKYLWSKLISVLYQLRDFPNIQNQDFIHFLTFLAIWGVLVTLIDFSIIRISTVFLKDFLRYFIILGILFFQFWMFFKAYKLLGLRKLMIFSYLCTTEFFPGFLVIYWLLNK